MAHSIPDNELPYQAADIPAPPPVNPSEGPTDWSATPPPAWSQPAAPPWSQPAPTSWSQPPPAQWSQSPYAQYEREAPTNQLRNARVDRPRQRTRVGGRVGAALAALLALIVKFKFLLIFLVKLPFLLAGLSFLVSAGLYSLALGWPVAIGFVTLLLIHELGHVAMLRAKGMPVSGVLFIPFLGAVTAYNRMPNNVKDQAEIAIAGPVAGAIAAAICWIAFQATGSPFWLVMAYFGFFLNLINLIPINPLDGGRVAAAISRWLWVVGLVVALALFIKTSNFLLLLILLVGVPSMLSSVLRRGQPGRPDYFSVPMATRALIGVSYVALIGILAYGMTLTQSFIR